MTEQTSNNYNDYDDFKDFYLACQNIVDNADQKSLNYAVNYAKAGLLMTNGHEARVQILYILNNMTHWRGDLAKETRATFKRLVKEWKK